MTKLPQDATDQLRTTLGIVMRIKSALLAIVALFIAAMCWIVLHLTGNIAADQDVQLSSFASWWITYPYTIVALAIPAVIVASIGALARRSRWAWLLLTLACTLIPVIVVLYCFLSVVGTLYRYEPL